MKNSAYFFAISQWKTKFPEECNNFIEANIPENDFFSAYNALITFCEVTHRDPSKIDLNLVSHLLKDLINDNE